MGIYIYIIVWQGRRLEILVHTDQCVSSFAAQARAQARADRPNDSGEGELGSYSLQIRANSESRHTIMRHIETFETYLTLYGFWRFLGKSLKTGVS